MRKRFLRPNIFLKALYNLVCLSLVMPVPILNGVAIASITDVKIKHKAPGSYVPGFRIKLKAQIEDSKGIKVARCYFKTKNEKNFSFVDMKRVNGNEYQAILPAPWINSHEVDYVFLVVTNDKKVVRSQLFKMKEKEIQGLKEWKGYGDVKMVRLDRIQEAVEDYEAFRNLILAKYSDELPDYQLATRYGKIAVKTEIDPENVKLDGTYDNVMIQEVPMSMKYGLLVNGLYSPDTVAAAGGAAAASKATGAVAAGTVTASAGGISAGWIALGALVAGGAAGGIAAASGGGGGGGSHHSHNSGTSHTHTDNGHSGSSTTNTGTHGLSDVSVSTRHVTLEVWDNGDIDGDQIDLIVNGQAVLSDYVLSATHHRVPVDLNSGNNVIMIHADNMGRLGKNTAALQISNVTRGMSSQSWELDTGQTARMTISAP